MIKRYDPVCRDSQGWPFCDDMTKEDEGNYVKWDDYRAEVDDLLAQIEALREELQRCEKELQCCEDELDDMNTDMMQEGSRG